MEEHPFECRDAPMKEQLCNDIRAFLRTTKSLVIEYGIPSLEWSLENTLRDVSNKYIIHSCFPSCLPGNQTKQIQNHTNVILAMTIPQMKHNTLLLTTWNSLKLCYYVE